MDWALTAPNPSLYDLRFAYSTTWNFQHKQTLARKIAAEEELQDRIALRREREYLARQAAAERAARRREFQQLNAPDNSWSSYVNGANNRYNSMMRKQQQRDMKNGIFYKLD